jgi:hypothetical protein
MDSAPDFHQEWIEFLGGPLDGEQIAWDDFEANATELVLRTVVRDRPHLYLLLSEDDEDDTVTLNYQGEEGA